MCVFFFSLSKSLEFLSREKKYWSLFVSLEGFDVYDHPKGAARNYAVCHPLARAQIKFIRSRVQCPNSPNAVPPKWSRKQPGQVSGFAGVFGISFIPAPAWGTNFGQLFGSKIKQCRKKIQSKYFDRNFIWSGAPFRAARNTQVELTWGQHSGSFSKRRKKRSWSADLLAVILEIVWDKSSTRQGVVCCFWSSFPNECRTGVKILRITWLQWSEI